jgi:PAS domain S-box-containing protein
MKLYGSQSGGLIRRGLVVILLMLLVMPPSLPAALPEIKSESSLQTKSILILYSASFYLPAYRKNLEAFMSVMDKAGFSGRNIYLEDLDLIRQNSPAYRQELITLLQNKYGRKPIDLIITVEGAARDFILKEGRNFLPSTPLLSILSADTVYSLPSSRRMIQIPTILDFKQTLQLALHLFPNTKRVFFVVGNREDERRWEDDAKRQTDSWKGKVEFEYSSTLTYEGTLQRLGALPPETVVVYVALYSDKTGRAFVPAEVAKAVTRTSNAPVFGVYDQILGLVVGGAMISYEDEGARAAGLALDIVSGKFTFSAPVMTLPIETKPKINWRELHRWGGREKNLPVESLIINQPPTIWKDYKGYVIGFLLLILLQAGMILSLLINRRRRIQAELNRQHTEKRYRQIVELANEGIWAVDGDYRTTFVNRKMADMLGYTPEEMIGRFADEHLHPEDLEYYNRSKTQRKEGQSEEYERRWVRKDGRIIWTFCRAVPLLNDQGLFSGAFGMFTDITERKEAEKNLIESEKRYRALFENLNAGFVLFEVVQDENGVPVDLTILTANSGFELTTGLKIEEVTGKRFTAVLPGIETDAADWIGTYGKVALTGESRQFEQGSELLNYYYSVIAYQPCPNQCAVTFQDITERKRAEEQLRANLKEKEILLQEIHHRVKNNLAIIASILSLQFPMIEDEKSKEIFRECENRVRIMAKIHNKLYQSIDFSRIDFGTYLQEVSEHLFMSYQIDFEAVAVSTHIENITLDINTALPLGLLVTELITNALKYAFPEGRKGRIEISLREEKNHWILSVADNGVGFPEGLDFQNTTTLGLQLVNALVTQLSGTIALSKDQGSVFKIIFPKSE